ncbi:MAG: hypothetical protein EXR62_15665 [Chloroflexi bacterium]|nr:hypothetical protein [Chloroflexota bacterium]
MQTAEPQMRLGKKGATFGRKLGILLSLLYVVLYIGTLYHNSTGFTGFKLTFESIGTDIVFIGLIFTIGGTIGGIPAVGIGMFTGGLIGFLIGEFQNKLTRLRACVLGVVISIIIALPLNLAVLVVLVSARERSDQADNWYLYLLYLGVPTLIYLCASGLTGIYLYTESFKVIEKKSTQNFEQEDRVI